MDRMGFRILGTLHIIVIGERDPAPNDWKAYLEAIAAEEARGGGLSQMRTLVFTDGGGPNAAQRKLMRALLDGRSPPMAIISASAMMRAWTTVQHLIDRSCRAYAPDVVGEALSFLGIPGIKFQQILRLAREIQLRLDISAVKSLESARFERGSTVPMRPRG